MWRSLERMQIHLRGFSAFNADCRTMNEALFDSHDPATVAVRLRRLECRVDWNVYVCCLNGHRISGSVLNIVCQTFGITLAPISAPLSLAVPEPQNEGILSIEHTFVLYCYRLQKKGWQGGKFRNILCCSCVLSRDAWKFSNNMPDTCVTDCMALKEWMNNHGRGSGDGLLTVYQHLCSLSSMLHA